MTTPGHPHSPDADLRREREALRLENAALRERLAQVGDAATRAHRTIARLEGELADAALEHENLTLVLQRLMESAGAIVVVCDARGRIIHVNPLGLSFLGPDRVREGESVLDEWLPDDDRATFTTDLPSLPWAVSSPLAEAMYRSGRYAHRHRLRDRSGRFAEFLVEAATLPGQPGRPEGILICATGTAPDMVPRPITAEAGADVRTPLNAVVGLAQLLVAEGPDDDARREYARTILDASHNLMEALGIPRELPHLSTASVGRGFARVAPDARPGHGIRVLVAEDNAINVRVIDGMLRYLGYQTTFVSNGQQAVDTLGEGRSFDIVLMDIQMPELDGCEATRRIRWQEQRAGRVRMPIVALTASVLPADLERYRDAGIDEVLAKPIELGRLNDVLQQWANVQ